MGISHVGFTVVTVIACLAGAGTATGPEQANPPPDTSMLEGADGAVLEALLADGKREDAGELTLRTRIRQRSFALDRVSLYRKLVWTLPSGSQVHVVAERDPGEPDWHDFVAFYGRWQMSDALQVHAGDLRPGFGQGVVFSRGGGRGGTVVPQMRRDSDRIGYRASGENDAVRGASVRFCRHHFDAILLAGVLWRDARLNSAGKVISLPESGRHVTDTELLGKDLLSGTIVGTRLRRMHGGLELGATLYRLATARKVDLRRSDTRPAAFVGDRQLLMGFDGSIGRHRRGAPALFWGAAVDERRKWALVTGVGPLSTPCRWKVWHAATQPGFTVFSEDQRVLWV